MINVETYGTNIMFPIGEKRVSEHFSIRLGGATLAVFAHSHESPPAEGFPNYDNPDAEPPEPDRYVAQIISEKICFCASCRQNSWWLIAGELISRDD